MIKTISSWLVYTGQLTPAVRPISFKFLCQTALLLGVISLVLLAHGWASFNPYLVTADHALFYEFAYRNYPSIGAFSSLFLDLSRWVLETPLRPYYLYSSLMATSFFIMGLSLLALLHATQRPKWALWVVLGSLLSLGCWTHVTSNFWNDVPLSAISFALGIGAFTLAYLNPQNKAWWLLHFLLMGFALSWKTYNIFGLIPILLFSLPLYSKVHSSPLGGVFKACAFMLMGYLGGMYHLLTDPLATLNGIRGYPLPISWKRLAVCWIPLPQFSRGIYDQSISTALTIGCLPFPLLITWLWLYKRVAPTLLAMLIGVGLLFNIYILKFGFGLNRHGFPLSWGLVFAFTMMLLALPSRSLCVDDASKKMRRWVSMGIIGSLLVTFGYFVPTQFIINWGMHLAVGRLNHHSNTIFNMIQPYRLHYPNLHTFVFCYRWLPEYPSYWIVPFRDQTSPLFGMMATSFPRRIPLQKHDPRFTFIKETALFHIPKNEDDPILIVIPSFKTPIFYPLSSQYWQFFENKYTSEMVQNRRKTIIYKNNDIRIVLYRKI